MNLPNVFQNKNANLTNNNQQELFYGNERKQKETNHIPNIDNKIKSIFSSSNFVYKINVHIKTTKGEFDTIIVGKTNSSLITYDNNLINIKDIVDLNEK